MKNLLISLCFLAGSAVAGPDDLIISQRNSADTGTIPRTLIHPSSPGVLGYDSGTLLPQMFTFGSGISVSSGVISAGLSNVGTPGTYSGVTTDAQGRVTAGTVRSFSYQTRALNTCFQVSAARDAFVTYAVDISATLSLSGGQVGTVYLRSYTNNTCTTGAQEITRFVNGNTGSLTVGLNTTQNATGTLTGIIPAGLWVQQVTENTTGTPSFTARPGQEVLL